MGQIDLSYVRRMLGAKIFERAEDYYLRGNVLETAHDADGWLHGIVRGSNGVVYETDVHPETDKYYCTCPYAYGGPCKHVGALMLEYLHMTASTGSPEPDIEDEPVKEKIIAFDRGASSGLFAPKKPIPGKKDAAQRFRLAFTVRYVQDWTARDFFITPALQFIKKDGSDGRIDGFDQRKLSETVSEAEQELLSRIQMNPGTGIPLITVCDLLEKNSDILIFLEEGRTVTQVRIAPLKKIIVSFSCTHVSGARSVFSPVFCVPHKKETVPVQAITCTHAGTLAQGSGIFFYNASSRAMNALLIKILSLRPGFSYGDIRELEAVTASDPACGIAVDFAPTKMKIVTEKGTPVLELDETWNGVSTELFFDYGGREIPYTFPESFLNLDNSGANSGFFNMAQRSRSSENAVRNFVRETLMTNAVDIKHGMVRTTLPLGQFLERCGRTLVDAGIILRMKKSRRRISGSGKIALRMKNNIDWFDAEAFYRGDDGVESALEIDLLTLKSGLVRAGSEYVFIGKDDIAKLAALQKDGLGRNGKLRIHKLNFSAAEIAAETMSEEEKKEITRTLATYNALKETKGIDAAAMPKDFRGTLRHYQVEGYNWLSFLHKNGLNGCLADDMGLGKTVQTLALLQKLKEEKKLRPALLVVPVSTVANWEQEIARFAPKLTVLRHLGIERDAGEKQMRAHDIVITSYHTLRNDIGVFSKVGFSMLVLDEAQNIKNASTKAFKAVKSIRVPFRLALSGTPIENSTGELWALFDVLNPGLLGTKEEFAARFARPIEKYADADAAQHLRKLIFPFILRRKKEMVAKDLPSKEEIIVYCEMEPKQRKIYEAFRKECRAKVENVIANKGKERGAIEIFEALLKLRQIALFPALASKQFADIPSCKFDMLTEMLDDILVEDHKALVFSQFVKSLAFIESHIKDHGIRYSYIDGSTKDRKKEIDAFQNDPAKKVFLLSLKAGGVGINLTAADYVILFDPWWNPAAEAQAVDRSHRIGQTRKVTAYRLIVKNTVEEKILALQEKKRALVTELITEEASFFKSLSGKDIVGLFD